MCCFLCPVIPSSCLPEFSPLLCSNSVGQLQPLPPWVILLCFQPSFSAHNVYQQNTWRRPCTLPLKWDIYASQIFTKTWQFMLILFYLSHSTLQNRQNLEHQGCLLSSPLLQRCRQQHWLPDEEHPVLSHQGPLKWVLPRRSGILLLPILILFPLLIAKKHSVPLCRQLNAQPLIASLILHISAWR